MSSFALGLTKTAVEGTLSRVKSAIEEEDKQRVHVQDDLVFITGEFQMLQSFLNVASAERANNPVVQTWVRQLRGLAFDVEDCVEFVIHLDKASHWDWVRRLTSSLICMARPPLLLDVAVAEIKRLKNRVEDVSQRNTRYNLISDSNSTAQAPNHQPTDTAGIGAFHILTEVWKDASKLRTTGDLKKLITSEGSHLQVISLWHGSCSEGGAAADHHLGSTYIVKEAYDDPEIRQVFTSRSWVKLIHPFNPDQFLKSLLTQFYASSRQPNISADFRKQMKAAVAMENDQLMQQVTEQRYLVILEDLSSVLEWDAIKMYLPDSRNGSRIIVSTQHLGLARSCTGDPYQVLQLTRFSHGQSICAFSKKGSMCRSDIGELNWHLRCRGVISVLTSCLGTPNYICQVFEAIMLKREIFNKVRFEHHSWVEVPSPFDMDAFVIRLFLGFQSRNFRIKEIEELSMKGDQGLIQQCCKHLHEDDCLVIINGLESMEHWDMIKETFLSKSTKGTSIIVITKEESVGAYCVDRQVNRMCYIKDLEADEVRRRFLMSRGGSGLMEDFCGAHLFYDRLAFARRWLQSFQLFQPETEGKHWGDLHKLSSKAGVVSVCGRSGVQKSTVVGCIYYHELLACEDPHIIRGPLSVRHTIFSFVDVPCPFDLTEFSWRLLLDSCSNDLKAKENVVVGLIKGTLDPIQACCELLLQHKCLIVIDGLRSKHDWDKMRTILSPVSPAHSSCIIVTTNKRSVAMHCVDDEEDRLLKVKRPKGTMAVPPLSMGPSKGSPLHLVGLGQEFRILEGLLYKQGYSVISLWGIAGVGKSAMARKIYDGPDNRLCNKPAKKSWVDVPHPFHLTEFSRNLLLGFHSEDLQAKETAAFGIMEGHDTIEACCQFLQENECLVFIDGLRSTHEWDLIKAAFLFEPSENIFVIITTESSVARHCVSHKSRMLNVKGLNSQDSFRLFRMIAWGGLKRSIPEEMKFSEITVAKCGGLPKVITAIGEFITKRKPDGVLTESILEGISRDINGDFMGNLQTRPEFHSLRGLFSWMQSYFDACSDSLKPCIFYISVFPKGHQTIRRRRLVRRWIAEGYSRDTFGSRDKSGYATGTAEENGERMFADLVELSIVQQQQTPGSKIMFQVNGFFHEYIISQPMEDNLVFALEGRCSVNSQRAGQHLTISSSWDRDKNVFRSMDFSRLRSLTVFGEWMSFFMCKDINMGLLRVLDLEDTSGVTNDDLEQVGMLLPRLKFFSIRGCKDITRLPNSLGKLRLLETLDVRNTSIVKLPPTIIKLHKLQYIRAGMLDTAHEPLAGEGVHPGLSAVDEEDQGLAAADEDDYMSTSSVDSSTSTEDNNGATTSAAGADGTCASLLETVAIPLAEGEDTSTTQPAANSDETSTGQPEEAVAAGGNGARQGKAVAGGEEWTPAQWRSRARHLVASYSLGWLWLSKKKKNNGGGVEVPAAGMGNLTALHTLGVVKISGKGGKAILEEVKKLSQLRKLGVSGINRKSWLDLCSTISDLGYLESLSVCLDSAASLYSCSGEVFSSLPKTLKSLKLYASDGKAQLSPVLTEQLVSRLGNLKKVNLELTISTQEEIDRLMDYTCKNLVRHICVKPIQDGELRYGRWEDYWSGGPVIAPCLRFDCGSYNLAIVFGDWIPDCVEVLVFQCSSTESRLQVSGLEKLENLKEVWLKGSYSDAFKQQLHQEVALRGNKPILKLEGQPRSS